MKCDELKDYSILDIEAIDDDRFKKEKAPGKWVPESRVYIKSEADKVIAEKDKEIAEQESEIAELQEQVHEYAQYLYVIQARAEKEARHHKYKRCLTMAEWCEATALWSYQAANTLPVGFHATLYGKPVMIEPGRLYNRFELLTKWSNRWMKLAKKFKEEAK